MHRHTSSARLLNYCVSSTFQRSEPLSFSIQFNSIEFNRQLPPNKWQPINLNDIKVIRDALSYAPAVQNLSMQSVRQPIGGGALTPWLHTRYERSDNSCVTCHTKPHHSLPTITHTHTHVPTLHLATDTFNATSSRLSLWHCQSKFFLTWLAADIARNWKLMFSIHLNCRCRCSNATMRLVSSLLGLEVGPMYLPAAVGKVSKDKYCIRRSRRHITVLQQQMQLFLGANGM